MSKIRRKKENVTHASYRLTFEIKVNIDAMKVKNQFRPPLMANTNKPESIVERQNGNMFNGEIKDRTSLFSVECYLNAISK